MLKSLDLLWVSSQQKLVQSVRALNEDKFWGSKEKRASARPEIRPFTINVPDEVLEDLRWRLKNTRNLIPPLEGIHQQYGFNTNTLREVIDYWINSYNWRERETFLNSIPQYKTEVQGLNIHFLRAKPKKTDKKILPLLLLHGWPGSVREFYEIIPLLTNTNNTNDFAFEVIAPSLPGFGFSDGASIPGLGTAEIAVVLKNLMRRLSFDKFYVQGGDLGALIAKNMAILYPENVLGLHSNLAFSIRKISQLKIFFGSFYPSLIVSEEYSHHLYPLKKRAKQRWDETGYLHIQATKPDTVGVGLSDSPAALAAYILEKFSTGTNPNYRFIEGGGLLEKFTYAQLLDNLMIYWITACSTTAMRLYAETFNNKQPSLNLQELPISGDVPCAAAKFKYEIIYQPDCVLKDTFTNLIQSSYFDYGGHFVALEVPEVLAEDIYSAVAKMEAQNNKTLYPSKY